MQGVDISFKAKCYVALPLVFFFFLVYYDLSLLTDLLDLVKRKKEKELALCCCVF